MTEWDKLKERMMDYIKSMDDTPTEEQTTIYDLMVGGLIGEGNKLQQENKQLKRQSIQDHEDYGNLLDKKHELNQKLEAIRGKIVFSTTYSSVTELANEILEVLGE